MVHYTGINVKDPLYMLFEQKSRRKSPYAGGPRGSFGAPHLHLSKFFSYMIMIGNSQYFSSS